MLTLKKVRHYSLPVFLFLASGLGLSAQTTIRGTVSDSLNNPIPFASVYLSKTTTGVSTDSKGVYKLDIPQNGAYEMITSCVGYKSSSQLVRAEGEPQVINVKLRVNSFLISEVTVKASEKNRVKDYTQFVKLFLGNSKNSQSCRITNLKDLRLYKNSHGYGMRGYSVKPLRIENNALGYTIVYDLEEFSYDDTTGILKFSGNHYFQPLKGTSRSSKKWMANRLYAYYGSRMHLLRSIFVDSLKKENFQVFENNSDPATKEYSAIIPISISKVKNPNGKNSMILFYDKTLWVTYTENHPEIYPGGLLGFQPGEFRSSIHFSDTLSVYQNGYFDKPYSVLWGGKLADERIADMLPFDFQPNEKVVYEPETNENISRIDKYLASQQNSNSKDQVFVHMDRNMYNPGDTILFQAYIRNRFTGEFETSSASLYAMLFNSKNEKVDSSRFKIEGSTAPGWMAIPTSANSGRYHFVAFTSKMQNFDPSDAFQLDLYVDVKSIDPERIEIAFSKENYRAGDTLEASVRITDPKKKPVGQRKFQYYVEAGRYSLRPDIARTNDEGKSFIRCIIPDSVTDQPKLHIITKKIAGKASMTKDFSIPFRDRYLGLRFLPEGGTLVAGIEQRIGFNATNRRGETVMIEGLLKNSSGSVLDTIRSGFYGPGLFVCKPEQGMYVELMDGAYENKIWPLPNINQSGLCLSVKPIDDRSFAVEIKSDRYNGESVIVSGTMNLNKIFSEVLILNKKQRVVVETDQLSSGVAQITLFDKEFRPIAERLFYVNADQHLKFNIKAENEVYRAGQETELAISVTDGRGNPVEGIFSLAVADSLTGHRAELFTPGIEYVMNYNPYLFGNLPPKALLQGLENIPDDQRDLLLMVYGWKRYDWDFDKKNSKEKELVNYDILNMKILYALKSRKEDRRLDLVSLEGPSTMHFLTNKKGEITLPLDSLPKVTRSVIMMPDVKNKMRVMGSMLSVPYNQQFFKSKRLFISGQTIPTYSYSIRSFHRDSYISLSDTTIEIPEIVVTGRKKEDVDLFVDEYAERYKYARVESLAGKPLWSAFSFDDALRRTSFNPTSGRTSMFGIYSGAFFVLDGQPLYSNGYGIVRGLPPTELTSITVLKGKQGFAMYGEAAINGVIFVNTWARVTDPKLFKIRNEWKVQNSNDHMLLPIEIYRPTIEYYNPTKAEVDLNPKFQSTPTIYWKSEVYFNGKEPVKIKFTNLKHIKRDGIVVVSVNGVSTNNLIGNGNASYLLNKVD